MSIIAWNDVETYYSEEACAYFAIALHRLYGYELMILVDEAEDPVTVAHVFTISKYPQAIDVFGKTTIAEVKSRYYDLEEPATIYLSEAELISEFMGNDKQLFPYSDKEINEAIEIIKSDTKWSP